MTTAETAWAEAMKFDNRADPYPFFDELRKTPVARVADDTYVVTGYRELMALAHDPRISSDSSRSPLRRQSPRPRPSPAAGAEPTCGHTVAIRASSCLIRPITTGHAVR